MIGIFEWIGAEKVSVEHDGTINQNDDELAKREAGRDMEVKCTGKQKKRRKQVGMHFSCCPFQALKSTFLQGCTCLGE